MANHAVITVDTDGVITGWDDGAETLIGHPARDAIGRRVDFIVPSRFERRTGLDSSGPCGSLRSRTWPPTCQCCVRTAQCVSSLAVYLR